MQMADIVDGVMICADLDVPLGLDVRESKWDAKRSGRGPSHTVLAVGVDTTIPVRYSTSISATSFSRSKNTLSLKATLTENL